jgi:class 3 adenylate cyclase
MDSAFEVILNEVHRYEGTVNQFLGDGVMALFGALGANEDHAQRALSAALAIQRGLTSLTDEVRRLHGVEFRMRMGINTGLVVVGAIGRDLRMDYTAVGDTTNLAARLLGIAEPGQIVVSQHTQQLSAELFVFADLGEFQVEGKREPVRAYAVSSEISGQTRLEVSRARGLTPLAGRDQESGSLAGLHRQATDGQGMIQTLLATEGGVEEPVDIQRVAVLDPRAYTPKHLADKILHSKAALEGERKQVTVLFSDVSGFAAISENLDPEDVHAIMDSAFEVILNEVHRYEGTVNQFLGDGVMALFGAPVANEDHAQRALSAALVIQRGLTSLTDEVRRLHGVEFRMRMGINTGLVVVGAIGRDLRMDYTAVGDTTNLAARLLGIAEPGQIVVSRRTQQLSAGFFVFEDLGEFQVKGRREPVRTYAVSSEISGQTRLEVSRERGLTPLVGREQELGALAGLHRRAADG